MKRILALGRNVLMAQWAGRSKYARYFEAFFDMALQGLAIGTGGGIEESGEIRALEYMRPKTPKDKEVIFDVGANRGEWALQAARIHSNATIYSFEPSHKIFAELEANTEHLDSIVPLPLGLGDKAEKRVLFSNPNNLGLSSLYDRKLDHFDLKLTANEEVAVETLDSFCEERKISHIHILKMDVEGHELSVLRGAEKLLKAGAVDFIQFEFGGCNIDSRTYFQDFWYLLKGKYDFYRIMRHGLYPIKHYRETLEIFVTTNYLCERIK